MNWQATLIFIGGFTLSYAGFFYFESVQPYGAGFIQEPAPQEIFWALPLDDQPDDDEQYEASLGALPDEPLYALEKDGDADDEYDAVYEARMALELFKPTNPPEKTVQKEPGETISVEGSKKKELLEEAEDETLMPRPPKIPLQAKERGRGGGFIRAYRPGDVRFSEIAWMGTALSSTHEWIELVNTTSEEIDLAGFSLMKGKVMLIGESGDEFLNTHRIASSGYFLLEREEEATPVKADKLYDGSLGNSGADLILYDAIGTEIDRISMAQGWSGGRNEVSTQGYKPTMTFIQGTWRDGSPTPRALNKETAADSMPIVTLPKSSFATSTIVLTEIAWMGGLQSAFDEWIELYNTASSTIFLEDWTLEIITLQSTSAIALHGKIAPFGYFLLERTDDESVSDVPADVIYTASLSNDGALLLLKDPSGHEVDRVGVMGGDWYAGQNDAKKTMQKDVLDRLGTDKENWYSAPPTPKVQNRREVIMPSEEFIPPLPLSFSFHDVLINEIAWMGTGASAADEWMELRNNASTTISLEGWKLTVADSASSTPYLTILFKESEYIPAHGYFLLERSASSTLPSMPGRVYSGGQLKNAGAYLVLQDPDEDVIDVVDASEGWPAGSNITSPAIERRSMERFGEGEAWYTYSHEGTIDETGMLILDGAGSTVLGSPGIFNTKS